MVKEIQNWEHTHGRVPLDTCPWCGSQIQPIGKNEEQHFRCSNLKCTFGGKNTYPVRLCDEQIYKTPPTLLFGTVDKFAQLAHKVDESRIEKDLLEEYVRKNRTEKGILLKRVLYGIVAKKL